MSDIKIADHVSEIAKYDINDLNEKIESFASGNEDEEKFRSFRLARGVYGQRQEGVQMIRIKLPYGRVSAEQLIRIADVADKYATEKMHTTTRQDIQIHYVKMAEAPQLWADLEEKGITLKEACGNTVRNVTGSAEAGVLKNELFDITPYAHAFFEYFLRNPINQEMGRKFKAAFSSDDTDSAFTFMHDLGFIPRVKDGVRGFKVVVAGGLGSQPMLAQTAHEFLPTDKIIPFAEAVLRVFDQHGERSSRGKARMKFLLKKIGFDAFMQLVEEKQTAVINKTWAIDGNDVKEAVLGKSFAAEEPKDAALYKDWIDTNVIEQKQEGFSGVYIKLLLGNMFNETARKLAAIVQEGYAGDDIRVTVNQGLFLRNVKTESLSALFNKLYDLDLVDAGHNSTADITACPGTDTCNLGISSSTGVSRELERVMKEEYHDLIYNNDIKIKISGCMNACGQHNASNIGFQGMSIKKGPLVMPAMQILLGGGFDSDFNASVGDKTVKVPSKVAPDAFRAILEDFDSNKTDGEYFNNYYRRQVEADKLYFFSLLKPFTSIDEVADDFYVDWGEQEKYVKAIGVGECAGVILDLVGTLIGEAEEKFGNAEKAMDTGNWQDAIYHSYNTFVVGAKALLVGEGVNCNTQMGIINDFDTHFVDKGLADFGGATFKQHVTRLDQNEPSLAFAKEYYAFAKEYIAKVKEIRTEQVSRMQTA